MRTEVTGGINVAVMPAGHDHTGGGAAATCR
jgi:hypothetical protein